YEGTPVLPIYFDQCRYLAQMDAALIQGAGVIIVADHRHCGRHALLEAWLQRLTYDHRPKELATLDGKSALSPLAIRRLNRDLFDSGDDAFVFSVTRHGRGACLPLRNAEGHKPGWMDDVAVVADMAQGSRSAAYKVLIAIPKERESQLVEAHPFFKALPRVV